VAPIDDIRALAEKHRAAAASAIDRGREHGYDAAAEAAEEADIARLLTAAAREMLAMSPADAQDYAHRMKAALWARLDDSPELGPDDAEAHP